MILDDLVTATKKRLVVEKQQLPLIELKKQAESLPVMNPNELYQRFLAPTLSIIAEVKKASPSKGLIAEDFDYLAIAKEYEAAGATAISVLTEPDYFLGNIDYLKTIAEEVPTPLLRKDFTIDPYMIYQAKVAGARMILLIVAILSDEELSAYLQLAHSLGLAVLVEAHDEEEINRALKVGAQMIGVNNRNLKDFTVSFENSKKLRHLIPETVAFVAESGVSTVADIQELKKLGVNAVLVGEALMKASDKKGFIKEALE
ncbi:Indole-3-glycerol phosphate synthase (TrpC) [Fructobacillus fructosus]|uniref:indole-3-glycerol phosphate synthase TrpC n=1 Tax=Fructobacillus fructosus TaxID=1631 RepID=UPI00021940C5|nr:indole-3-glycerol phosphate synthase TrpC [Fructobacillus fructosus]KRN52026.1 Indole-3-glycerol-phosphate synthase [Fructobacillus fructosus KCTC 3544]GAP01626.1 indole-3-glycerol phosphate synthase [Fructobacillus fructosus]CAK1242577.1 Indole-3-glycerol phosphate synthase (TrpC) [Fructobacillus fructosus]